MICNKTYHNNIGHNFPTYWAPFHSMMDTISYHKKVIKKALKHF